jgi:hypothetical protein
MGNFIFLCFMPWHKYQEFKVQFIFIFDFQNRLFLRILRIIDFENRLK